MLGAEYDRNSSGMFLWGRVGNDCPLLAGTSQMPAAHSDLESKEVSSGQQVSDRILYEAGVFITPGFIFGKNGENYIRISLCAKPEVLRRAAEKIKNII